jgi:uncharacterized membrane protein
MPSVPESLPDPEGEGTRAFRTAVIRGLGGLLAPLLTIVILLWIWQTLKYYVLQPVETATRNLIAWQVAEIHDELPLNALPTTTPAVYAIAGRDYQRLQNGQLIPREVYDTVVRQAMDVPVQARDYYRRWVEIRYLKPWIVVPVFLIVFFGVMYLIGSLFAAGLGHVFWTLFEDSVGRVPFVRAVYGPVKQVTEYMLSEHKPDFRRVVAVEYPRRGVWTIAFVTGEGMADVQKLSGEPMVTVLFPTCPTPIAGNTKMVPRRETIDLAMSVDSAVQYILSFGVVVPEQQIHEHLVAANRESNGAVTIKEGEASSIQAGKGDPI